MVCSEILGRMCCTGDGFLIDRAGWRSAFVWPGAVCVAIGLTYAVFLSKPSARGCPTYMENQILKRGFRSAERFGENFCGHFFSTAVGGLVFQSTTFSLPKVFDERLGDLALTATQWGIRLSCFRTGFCRAVDCRFFCWTGFLENVFLAVVEYRLCFLPSWWRHGSVVLAGGRSLCWRYSDRFPLTTYWSAGSHTASGEAGCLGSLYRHVFGQCQFDTLIAWIYGFWGFDMCSGY
ncbi:MAG: hypothetical protein Ct9H300mP16_03890 [Pseudomonadota bacterium]|nr:MAG: hypothetical protein Ct9H300mP16_03890 [Pseudomonadota bacterium]